MQVLADKKLGVVAHFYMDPEVQGVLAGAAARWPHIHVSDSLVMADAAVRMAEAGCRAVAVLGVDFMSENVRAILDEAGFRDVQVRESRSCGQQGVFIMWTGCGSGCYAYVKLLCHLVYVWLSKPAQRRAVLV